MADGGAIEKGHSKVKWQVACEETNTLPNDDKKIKPYNAKTLPPISIIMILLIFSLSTTHRINALFSQQNQIDIRLFFHHAL